MLGTGQENHCQLSESPNQLIIDSTIQNHDQRTITYDLGLEPDCLSNRTIKSDDIVRTS